jgi:hypothetical protein
MASGLFPLFLTGLVECDTKDLAVVVFIHPHHAQISKQNFLSL